MSQVSNVSLASKVRLERTGPKMLSTIKGTQTISPKDSVFCTTPEDADKKVLELRKSLGDTVTVRRFGLCVNVYK